MPLKQVDPNILAEGLHKLEKSVKELNEKATEAKLHAATVEKDITHLKSQNHDLEKKNASLEQRTSELQTRVKAANHNAAARLANSRHTDPKQSLKPLHDAVTNKSIDGFPRREGDIRVMGGGEVVRILKELEAPMGQTPADRKGALREAVGLENAKKEKGI